MDNINYTTAANQENMEEMKSDTEQIFFSSNIAQQVADED